MNWILVIWPFLAPHMIHAEEESWFDDLIEESLYAAEELGILDAIDMNEPGISVPEMQPGEIVRDLVEDLEELDEMINDGPGLLNFFTEWQYFIENYIENFFAGYNLIKNYQVEKAFEGSRDVLTPTELKKLPKDQQQIYKKERINLPGQSYLLDLKQEFGYQFLKNLVVDLRNYAGVYFEFNPFFHKLELPFMSSDFKLDFRYHVNQISKKVREWTDLINFNWMFKIKPWFMSYHMEVNAWVDEIMKKKNKIQFIDASREVLESYFILSFDKGLDEMQADTNQFSLFLRQFLPDFTAVFQNLPAKKVKFGFQSFHEMIGKYTQNENYFNLKKIHNHIKYFLPDFERIIYNCGTAILMQDNPEMINSLSEMLGMIMHDGFDFLNYLEFENFEDYATNINFDIDFLDTEDANGQVIKQIVVSLEIMEGVEEPYDYKMTLDVYSRSC